MTGGVFTAAGYGKLALRPCACVELSSRDGITVRNAKGYARPRLHGGRSRANVRRRGLYLQNSMTMAWHDSRKAARLLLHMVPSGSNEENAHHGPLVVDEFGGQYEENFDDVEKHLLDYFTYKAVKTVLAQLSEMNPHQYAWFYNFVVINKPQDSKLFIRILVKERQELAERVMVTRLHLFNKWVKKYNHAQMHKAISDQNLELLRERLIQTVKLTSNGDDIERPPLRGM